MKTILKSDIIESLKQALLFYANVENYQKNQFHENGLIHSDNGSQARFALSLIENYEQSDVEDVFETNEDMDVNIDSFKSMIEQIKKIE